VGQADFQSHQPNLIEGREVNFGSFGGGVVFDRNSNPPHLYVADLANNRVLGSATAARSCRGRRADLVIGQPDMFHAVINYPNGSAGPPTDSGLFGPTAVAVDANGNLIVADSLNGRLLRFPSPFDQPAGMQHANLVLGQASFTNPSLTDPSSQNMGQPWGLALLADGSIAASDVLHNRVLIFRKPRNGDFTNFQRAEAVLGQNDFNSRLPGNGINQLSGPRHMGIDSSDRLYVADTLNNRVMIFPVGGGSIPPFGLARAVEIPGLNQPHGVTVSLATGEAFIANTERTRWRGFRNSRDCCSMDPRLQRAYSRTGHWTSHWTRLTTW
jgi:DNA-binding beta-propeller fold protein YncE